MKHLLLMTCAIFTISALNAQNRPIDFEAGGNGANWTWTVFENDTNPALEIIANPDPSGINTSATVAKFTALQTGNPWAGVESNKGGASSDLGLFSIDSTNNLIRIMVWKSKISDVGIKLVNPTFGAEAEIKIPNTKIDEWEVLTFDVSSLNPINGPYDQIVVFPDFDLAGRTQDEIIYFDNLYGDSVSIADPTSISNVEVSTFSIYPNPNQGSVKITALSTIESIRVFDLSGKELMNEVYNAKEANLNTSSLESGIYMLKAIIEGEIITEKLIKN